MTQAIYEKHIIMWNLLAAFALQSKSHIDKVRDLVHTCVAWNGVATQCKTNDFSLSGVFHNGTTSSQ